MCVKKCLIINSSLIILNICKLSNSRLLSAAPLIIYGPIPAFLRVSCEYPVKNEGSRGTAAGALQRNLRAFARRKVKALFRRSGFADNRRPVLQVDADVSHAEDNGCDNQPDHLSVHAEQQERRDGQRRARHRDAE
jgi:hypothetical protein